MTTPNTPQDDPEAKNESKYRKNQNINDLLVQSIQQEMKNGSNVISPVSYDEMRYPEIYNAVRDKMKYLRDVNDADFTDIKDNDIISISDAKIIEKIEQYARPLKNARRNLFINLRRNFPNIREKIPGFSEGMLYQKIQMLDENEIVKVYHSNRTLIQFLYEYFGISRDVLTFRDPDFMSVFGTDNLRTTAPDLYDRTQKAAIAYKNSAISPPLSLIRELIGFYGSSDTSKKKEICDFFDIVISLPEALRSGFISDAEVETLAENEFSHVWDALDQNTRKSLIQALKHDDNYDIELATFDADVIARHFDSKKMKEIITRAVNKDLEKNKETSFQRTGITRDLQVEVGEDGIPKIHNSFLRKLKEDLRGKNGSSKILNIENFVVGSILVFRDESDRARYFRLDATDISVGDYDYGVTISDITGKEEGTIGKPKSKDNLSYDDVYKFLNGLNSGRVITANELNQQRTINKSEEGIGQDHILGEDKILDISETEDIMTLEGFIREINSLDPDGEKIGLGVGVAFAAKGVLPNGKEYEGTWTISDIHGSQISVSNGKGTQVATFEDFLNAIKSRTFRRIAKLENKHDLLHVLSESFGVKGHPEFDGTDLVTEVEEDDGHGHHKHTKKKYEFFQSKSGGHIRINGFSDGLVSFGEYTSSKTLADVQKVGNAGKLTESNKKGLYANQTMSYGDFVLYLKKNDLSATTDNILVPDATDTYHPHDPHLEGSLLSKMGSWWSIADMMKGFSGLQHGIEHYFEKSSRLNASRFALSMGRKLHLPLDIMAQLQADEVGSVKEVIEKIQEKFRNLNGPVGRKKALHIAHTKDARPEEVVASILHMVKGYGQLYAEDIAYAQGSESFINGLLNACGFRGQALTDMKKKAREKSKVLLGNEAGSDLSEEEMIWGFMKMMDGNHEKYPVAATLVKAMGGPSGFENAWRKDGFDGAYEKGIRQAGDLVNAEARVDHGLSALSTHEFHTAIGSMEKAAEKTPDPSIQTLPIVWALGGYSKYLSTKANQKIKSYADGKGHSLHAFSFLRSRTDNDIYRETFREALRTIAPEAVPNLDKFIHDLAYDGHDPKKADKIKPAINGLAKIWRQYQGHGLHDMLQGKNMWLVENANKNPKIRQYLEKMDSGHQNNGGDTAHPDDNGWYIQHGYTGSPIIHMVEHDGHALNSFDRTLRKVKLDTYKLGINKDHKERYWDPLVKIVKNLRVGSTNEELTKAQYHQYRKDILLRFNEAFSSKGEKAKDFKKQEYYQDLLDMGIDISVIFEDGGKIHKKIEKTAERDYIAWKNGGHQGGNVSNAEVQGVRDTVRSVISPRHDTGFQGAGRNVDRNRDPEFNTSDVGTGGVGIHELGDGSGSD
ncbi:hypothetical protein HOO68_01300 [Candidatus Gracilibacteria bacterium]|nr:hypothetical protein [Candidatus Gracilibacteria bacterium]